jgi:hypothetical protein
MNAFHVVGGVFAIWALTVTFLGVTRENFPASPGAERLVTAISILLAAGAIGSAIYIGATEDKQPSESAFFPPV